MESRIVNRECSVQIEVPQWLRHRFRPCLLQRLFESPCQRVVAVLLGIERLIEERLAPGGFIREDARRVAQLRLVPAVQLLVVNDAAQICVDDQRRLTAGALHLDFALQLRHSAILVASPVLGPWSLRLGPGSKAWKSSVRDRLRSRKLKTARRFISPDQRPEATLKDPPTTNQCPRPTGARCASPPTTS